MPGNKNSGRRKKDMNVRRSIHTYAPIAVGVLGSILCDDTAPVPQRIEAGKYFIDQSIGRPSQRVDVKQTEDITFRIITVPAAQLEPAIEGEVRLIE